MNTKNGKLFKEGKAYSIQYHMNTTEQGVLAPSEDETEFHVKLHRPYDLELADGGVVSVEFRDGGHFQIVSDSALL